VTRPQNLKESITYFSPLNNVKTIRKRFYQFVLPSQKI
jgi:hypothetical protein